MKSRLCTLLIIASTALVTDTYAAVHCVDNVVTLQAVLSAAASNGEHDELRLVAGSYRPAARLTYVATENFDLVVEGGWNAGCTQHHPDPAATVIDGSASSSGIVGWTATSNSSGHLGVRYLSFTSSSVGLVNAVELGSYSDWSGDLRVESVNFRNLAMAGSADFAVAISGGQGRVLVRNSVFAGNRMGRDYRQPQRILSRNQTDQPAGIFSGNTVTGNLAEPGTTGSSGAMSIQGQGSWLLVNNIFWNNSGADLVGNRPATLISNDIGVQQLSSVLQSVANVAVDPLLDDEARLQATSPLIDIGEPAPAGGAGAYDGFGQARLSGLTLDIGAYEFPRSFRDGFEGE